MMAIPRWALTVVLLGGCGEVIKDSNGTPDAPKPPDAGPGSDASTAAPQLFWVEAPPACDSSAIRRMPIDSSAPMDVISLPPPDQIADLTVEQVDGKVYYSYGQSSANTTETVERVNLDGTNRQPIKVYGTRPTPLGVAVDAATDSVFWITNGGCSPCPSCGACSTIEGARRDGSAETTVHELSGTFNPRMLALDAPNHTLYWCDLQFQPQIQRIDTNGASSTLQAVYSTPSSNTGVDDLELDVVGNKLYWLETALQIGQLAAIQRANLDGSGVERLVSVGGSQDATPRGLAVDAVGGKVYWTESGFCGSAAPGKIKRANLDGTNVETVLDGLGILVSIELVR